MKYIVYKYTCPENKVYIGITKRPKDRRKQHRKSADDPNNVYAFPMAIKKFGYDNLQYEVIDGAETREEICLKEKYWIKYYNSQKNGYNMTPGGEDETQKRLPKYKIDQVITLLKEGWTTRVIVLRTRVSTNTINNIRQGRTEHHPEPIKVKKRKPENKIDNIEEVLRLLTLHKDLKYIRNVTGVPVKVLELIKAGKTKYSPKIKARKRYTSRLVDEDTIREIKDLLKKGIKFSEICRIKNIKRNIVISISKCSFFLEELSQSIP